MSKLLSCLLGSESVAASEFLVPIEEFVLAPIMSVVLASVVWLIGKQIIDY
jgi:hypothetical protein